MPAPANLVHETSTTTGTGSLTLVNVNGKNNFNDAFGTGGSDVFDYFISNQSAAEWERGTGHMSDATTLVRDTVIESTNSDNAVNFSAGTKDITNDVPAAIQLRIDGGQSPAFTNITQTGYTDLTEISEPASPAANVARRYAKDIGGVTTLFAKDSTGRERVLQG